MTSKRPPAIAPAPPSLPEASLAAEGAAIDTAAQGTKSGKRKRLSKVRNLTADTSSSMPTDVCSKACDACHKSKRRCDGTGKLQTNPAAAAPDTSLHCQRRAVIGTHIVPPLKRPTTDWICRSATSRTKNAATPIPLEDKSPLLGQCALTRSHRSLAWTTTVEEPLPVLRTRRLISHLDKILISQRRRRRASQMQQRKLTRASHRGKPVNIET